MEGPGVGVARAQGNSRMWLKRRLEGRFESSLWKALNAVLRNVGLILKTEESY